MSKRYAFAKWISLLHVGCLLTKQKQILEYWFSRTDRQTVLTK
jgi:hypothetical protein